MSYLISFIRTVYKMGMALHAYLANSPGSGWEII